MQSPCSAVCWVSPPAATTSGARAGPPEESARMRFSPTRSSASTPSAAAPTWCRASTSRLKEDHGIRCGGKRVARLMRPSGIQGCHRRRRHWTTQRNREAIPAPDLVNRNFSAVEPNRLWTADVERHKALLDRVELGGLRPWAVAAAREKLGQPDLGGARKGGKQPRQRRDGPEPPDGPGPASETGRCR